MAFSGSLHLRFGPMTSGKTTWLNEQLGKYSESGMKCLKVISSKDTRGDTKGSTHNKSYSGLDEVITVRRVETLEIVATFADAFDVIGVDEAQFFPDLYDIVKFWVEAGEFSKHVLVVGLDGDFERKPFGDIFQLIPLADSVEKINAVCTLCTKKYKGSYYSNPLNLEAPFTMRTIENKEQVLIGGSEKYKACCRYHYLERSEK